MPGGGAECSATGTRFPGDATWHARIDVAELIAGPPLPGDGRYPGLCLMRADEAVPGALAFDVVEGLGDVADPLFSLGEPHDLDRHGPARIMNDDASRMV